MKLRLLINDRQNGYTLIELMVVVILMGILMIGVVGLFLTLLRGQSKTNALAKVKQEGDFSTVAIERQLRDGIDVVRIDIGVEVPCNENELGEPLIIYRRTENNKFQASKLYLDSGTSTLQLGTCLESETKQYCSLGEVTRALTGTEVQVDPFKVRCKQGGPFDPDLVEVSYTITEPASGLSVPFRVITSLRNIE
ncbi:hypothetical protein A2W24_04685 [Microgenomates group bacterium RBG_16_45_19]|nr:MAG: hypothetical protein A2W24_04685 [Microgenomates group bacterium RBG_16_45_19]